MCLYLCVHVNPPGGIHNEKQSRNSTVCQHWTVCVFEFYCVCTGKMAAYYIAQCIVCVCVREAVIQWPDSFPRERTHPCHYCSTHCWLTAFSTAREMSVIRSVTLLISSQSPHTSTVLTVPTGHWWFVKSILWPLLNITKLFTCIPWFYL